MQGGKQYKDMYFFPGSSQLLSTVIITPVFDIAETIRLKVSSIQPKSNHFVIRIEDPCRVTHDEIKAFGYSLIINWIRASLKGLALFISDFFKQRLQRLRPLPFTPADRIKVSTGIL